MLHAIHALGIIHVTSHFHENFRNLENAKMNYSKSKFQGQSHSNTNWMNNGDFIMLYKQFNVDKSPLGNDE